MEFIDPDFTNAPWKNEEELKAARLINLPLAIQYDAYKWLNAYLDQLNTSIGDYGQEDDDAYRYNDISFEELISTAVSHQGGKWGDYITRGGVFEGEYVEPAFWDKFADYFGIPRESVHENSFFSCSC